MRDTGIYLQVAREGQLPAQIGQARQREDVGGARGHAQGQPGQQQAPVPRLGPQRRHLDSHIGSQLLLKWHDSRDCSQYADREFSGQQESCHISCMT